MNKLKISKETVVHCSTEELAKQVLAIADKLEYKWCSGESFSELTNWKYCKENTYYNFHNGSYGSMTSWTAKHYTVMEAEDFIKLHSLTPKEILLEAIKECEGTDNVIIAVTDGGNYLCMSNFLLISTKVGFMRMSSYNENLETATGIINISEIHKVGAETNFKDVPNTFSKCIWKRETIKEVTLEEIAEAFGVEVENLRIKD